MPALLAMLALITLFSTIILLPLDLVGYARSVLATMLFASNIYFWRDTDYFSRAAEEKPLLHTWSLGIEEQFYIVFPLLLALCAKFRPRSTLPVILIVTLSSLVTNIITLKLGKALPAFYLLPTRAWELGLGALVAVAPNRKGVITGLDSLVGITGFFLVAASLVLNGIPTLDSVPKALPACLGAAALIWSGRHHPTIASRILSLRPIVFIGLVSYSLYLWHWPLIVLPKYYLVREFTLVESFFSATAALLLTVASWRFVERPFRSGNLKIGSVLWITGGGVLTISASVLSLISSNGFPSRLDPRAAAINAAVGSNYRCPIGDYLSFGALYACQLQLPSKNPADADVIIVGDSHSQMYAPAVSKVLKIHSLKGLLVPSNGCLPFAEPNLSVDCGLIAEHNLDAIAKLENVKAVIFAFNWDFTEKTLYFRDGSRANASDIDGVLSNLDSVLEKFSALGKKVILVGPIAIPGIDIASIVGRALAFGRDADVPLSQSTLSFYEKWSASIQKYSASADLIFVRPDLVQCSGERCEYFRVSVIGS